MRDLQIRRRSALLLTLLSLIGVPIAACDAATPRLLQADACGMVTAAVKANVGKNVRSAMRNLAVEPCTKFESISERGWAKIDITYSYEFFNDMTRTWSSSDLRDTCEFIRTDQGWKIQDCKYLRLR